MSEVDVSIVIVTWNTRELVLHCLDQLAAEFCVPVQKDGKEGKDAMQARRPSVEVFVVDNGSQDGSARAIRERHPWVELIALPQNVGFARGNNAALSAVRGRAVLLLNSDVSIDRAAVLRLLDVLGESADIAAVGPHLVHPDGRPQNTMHAFPSFWTELIPSLWLETLLPGRYPSKRRPPREPRTVEALRGAVLLVKREALLALGPLGEGYFFFLEETDWCLRAHRAGWRVVFVPDATAIHQLGASSKRVDPLATRIEYQRSLDHFLRLHRGVATARAVLAIRIVKSLGSAVLLSVPAIVSSRARRRAIERWSLLAWYFAGRPRAGGLADRVARGELPALDEVAETREDSPPGIADPVRGDG